MESTIHQGVSPAAHGNAVASRATPHRVKLMTRAPGRASGSSRPGPRTGWGWTLLLLVLLAGGPLQADITKEYQLKAAFLYNFAKFIEWPPHRFQDGTSPIIIGVLNPNPFGTELEKLVQDRKINGRAIIIRPITGVAEARSAHLVFVSAGADPQFAGAIDALRTAGVLTVGESGRFKATGGVITFVLDAEKVRFEINLDAGENAGLKISAQLLKLATTVHHKT